jgi:hypothetical protein
MRAISFIDWSNYVNGIQVSGFAEGDGVVEMEFLGKDTATVGADGQMSVHLSANKAIKVTIKLAPTSSGNAYLNKLYMAQRGGPRTMLPIVYNAQDSYRKDKVAGWHGIISAPPKVSRGEKAGDIMWEFTFQRGVIDLNDPDFVGLAMAVAELTGP